MKSFFLFITKLLIFCLLAGGGFVAYEAHRFLNTPASPAPEEVVIGIAPGSTFDRVAWDLKKAGVITDVTRFRLLAQFKDALGKVKAGEFLVNTGWTPEQVLTQITEGRAVLYRLALREGLTWWETAKAVEAQGFATYDDFKAVIHDPVFLKEHNIPFANAEGFLFPETYLMKKPRSPLDREQAREVASAMVRMFWKKTEPLWKELPKKADGVTPGAMQSPPPGQPKPAANTATQPLPRIPEAQAGPGRSQERAASQPAVQPATQAANQPGRKPTDQQAGPVAGGAAGQPVERATDGAPQAAALADAILDGSDGAPTASGAASSAAVSASSGEGGAQSASAASGEQLRAAPPTAPALSGPESPAEVDPEALRRLVILASLVEKETGVPSERGLVAGVYANRLRLGMLLQCDPTIIYGIGERFSGAIRRSQLDDPKNLYNTYQHPGLPPGPIASSGFDALKASASPPGHDYLYFVATGIDGGHTFSKTLAEHNKAVQVYRARMRGKN